MLIFEDLSPYIIAGPLSSYSPCCCC